MPVIRVRKAFREPRVLRETLVFVDPKEISAHRELRVQLERRVHRVPQEHRDNVVPKGTKEIRAVSVHRATMVLRELRAYRAL
jgi:hypothetical protein